ncbi:MAG: histidine kinase, partial [Bacteroidetes bacterium]
MNRTHLLLSVLVSVLMPALSLLNNVAYQSRDFRQIMTSWVVGGLFLFLLWWANLWISRQMKLRFRQNVHTGYIWVFQLAASLLMIALFIGSNPGGVRIEVGSPWWVLSLRLLAGATMIIGIQVAVDSSSERQTMRIANIRLQNENLEARFELLKQQINPHFLFNALSTLRIMVRAGDPHAEQFTLTLSDLYRQLLSNRNATTVSLSQELTFLRSYLFMLKSRFEDMLEVQLDMMPESETRQIPAFALQLLV